MPAQKKRRRGLRSALSRSPKHPRWKSYSLLLIAHIISGALFVIVKPSLGILEPSDFLLYRFVIAFVATLPIWFFFRNYVGTIAGAINSYARVVPLELAGTALPLLLVYEGLSRINAISGNLLATTQPLFITFFGVWLLREREEAHEVAGLLLAFGGTVLLTLLPIINSAEAMTNSSFLGNILVMTSLVLTGIYYPVAKRRYHNFPKFLVTLISIQVNIVVFGALTLQRSGFSGMEVLGRIMQHAYYPEVWLAVGYSALAVTLFSWTFQIKGQEHIESSEASLFSYIQPLVYLPLGYLVLGEVITLGQLVALGAILLGVYIAEKRFKPRRMSWQRRLLRFGR